jgi:hypothetical protein
VTYVPENDGTQVPSASAANVILPYSIAAYTALGNPKTGETNLHNGAVVNSVSGTAATVVNESKAAAAANVTGNGCSNPVRGQFCASRYIYHVTDQQLGVNHASYQQTILFQVVSQDRQAQPGPPRLHRSSKISTGDDRPSGNPK